MVEIPQICHWLLIRHDVKHDVSMFKTCFVISSSCMGRTGGIKCMYSFINVYNKSSYIYINNVFIKCGIGNCKLSRETEDDLPGQPELGYEMEHSH